MGIDRYWSSERQKWIYPSEIVERARIAFGNALAVRVNMKDKIGNIPVQVIREAMIEALIAADEEG